MSESKRKSKLDSKSSSSNEESSNSDDDISNGEIQVEFEGRAPIDPDCHGIRQLLQRVFLKAHVDCMQAANLIIKQNFVGSVIDQCESTEDVSDDEDDNIYENGTIFGITTVLNLTNKKDEPCIKEIRSHIIQMSKKHASDTVLKRFQSIFDDDSKSVGYLINERFINIPAQISVPLLSSLHKEVNAAKDKGMLFDFIYYVMIIKMCRKESKNGKPIVDHYVNAEEEIITKKALCSFEYSVADECDSTMMSGSWLNENDTLTPYRKVILFNANDFSHVIADIQNYITKDGSSQLSASN